MEMLKIGENIRQIRLHKKLSQENVAEMLNISLLTYGEIERDKKDITLSRLTQIAHVFDVDVNKILKIPEKAVFNQNHN
jgi:XRE family transcriptional regulator, regulator of sulfur utilization